MTYNPLLKIFSGVVALAIVGMLAWQLTQEASQPRPGQPGSGSESVDTSTRAGGATAQPGSRLTVGVMGAAPSVGEVVSIKEIPWLPSQINQAYREAEYNTCQLLLPDLPVAPPLTTPEAGQRGHLGRVPAFTIGLEIDDDAKSKLPATTKSTIVGYLRDHQIAIAPILYQDEQGQAYFGTDCRAAFFPVRKPDVTVRPEPMVQDAIARFRVLGVLGGDLSDDGRTLVMAFRYLKSQNRLTGGADGSQFETELFFLHLAPNTTPGEIAISVYATTEGRQNLHRLAVAGKPGETPVPSIIATIRFDSFVMMGLYPSQPVVTGVKNYATSVLGVDTIRRLTSSELGETRLSFQAVLDRFARGSEDLGVKDVAPPSVKTP